MIRRGTTAHWGSDDGHFPSIFARISRAGRLMKRASCLHECMLRKPYGEQRELGMRSITSLLINYELSRFTSRLTTLSRARM